MQKKKKKNSWWAINMTLLHFCTQCCRSVFLSEVSVSCVKKTVFIKKHLWPLFICLLRYSNESEFSEHQIDASALPCVSHSMNYRHLKLWRVASIMSVVCFPISVQVALSTTLSSWDSLLWTFFYSKCVNLEKKQFSILGNMLICFPLGIR